MSSIFYVITINLILLSIRFTDSYNRDGGAMLSELKYLSELPLDKLLKVRKSLQEVSCLVDENYNRKIVSELNNSTYYANDRILNYDFGHFPYRNHTNVELGIESREDLLEAAALMSDTEGENIMKKSYGVEEKPSKVQTIFQLSITALAFFAFGGYLLCMIVQAIKSKGTTYFHPSLMPMSTAGSVGAIKKRRPSYGRKRRKREAAKNRGGGGGGGPAPEDLYNALRKLAENYVQIQQI